MNTNVELHGNVAVVTGASRGVGQAIALALASQGARVALVARSVDALQDTSHHIANTAGASRAFPCDLTDAASIEMLARDIRDQLGAPAILVNAAGMFGPFQTVQQGDAGAWIATQQLNVIAPYLLCRAFVGDMIDACWGRIINVSSAAALHTPGPMNSAYGVSKVALNQLTRQLAAEIAGTGVTANAIHPGDVKTEMWADIRDQVAHLPASNGYRQWVKWVEETGGDPPEKAAQLVLRLCSVGSAGVNGQFLWIEDGLQKPITSW
jgi:NAD(P)-dependent dehydrogenase (short-subunit alcohol dehydrogenase family)